MKPLRHVLSAALLLGSWAAAQADPFLRSVPAQSLPSMRAPALPQAGTPTPPAAAQAVSAQAVSATPAASVTAFGNPRSSSDGGTTRVVFDLPTNVNYTLAPTFGGLRIDVQGTRVIPATVARMGTSVTEYRAGAGQATLVTPFPLSLSDGWRAYEATIPSGTKVLVIEFGPTLSGGAASTVRGKVLASAPTTSPALQAALNTPIAGSTVANQPPGDTVRTGPLLPAAPSLPGDDSSKPSVLQGRVPGTPSGTVALAAPRVGINPGQTRMVLDLPAGTSYRLVTSSQGLRVELGGVQAADFTASSPKVSSEVRSWHFEPTTTGTAVVFQTPSPVTARSGFRAQLLPPSSGSTLSRLAIDFSPAIADTTPLSSREKLLAGVPPLPAGRGTALLSVAASYVRPKVVLDPGHGGIDPGAVGSVMEKQTTLDVALRVRDLLQAAGVDVVMTRSTDTQLSLDKNTDLNMRAAMGAGAQMYVSIHVNAMPAANALRGYGVETWWNPNHPLSSSLASLLQKDLVQSTAAYDQGLHNTRSLAVLRNSRIPAALVEIGFASHPVDGQNLKDNNYLDRVALGIANGIRDALVSGVTASGTVLGAAGGAGK